MTKTVLLSLFVLLICGVPPLLAGGIRGVITDEAGEPLPYATIYISQTQSGTTSNDNGNYQLSLDPGQYTVTFQYLGFQTVSRTVDIGPDFATIDIQLKTQIISLSTVEIDAGREDPAYTIMRKAIAKSKYHLNQLDSYTARVYMKGSGRFKKIPRLFRNQMKKEGIDTSRAFVSEVVSEVTYRRPNEFKERVISARRQGDASTTDITAFINGSFYRPRIGEAISPLAPQAFAYYKFVLEGSFFDQGVEVNAIRVIPRRRGEEIFEGILNIVDGQWSIHSLQLNIYRMGFLFDIQQIYKPIEGRIWLPISHSFQLRGSAFGFEGEFNYLAAISDYQLTFNPDLKEEPVIVDETIEREKAAEIEKNQKSRQQSSFEERLSSGKELTRKEMRNLMNSYEKAERKASEEPQVLSNRSFEIDSLAYRKDTVYWDDIRPVPLTHYEIKGGKTMDSLVIAELKEAGIEPSDTALLPAFRKKPFRIWDVFTGQHYSLDRSSRIELIAPLTTLGFNTVEGYQFTHGLSYRKRLSPVRTMRVGATGRYSLARHQLTGVAFLKIDRGGLGRSQKAYFHLEGGRSITQINQKGSIHPLVNSLMTLLLEENYMKLFEKDYFALRSRSRLRDNLSLIFDLEWARRYPLQNNSDHHWINSASKSYTSNMPENGEWAAQDRNFQTHNAAVVQMGLHYWPFQKYRVRDGIKRPIAYSSPEISLQYRKGLGDSFGSDSEFNHAEAGLRYSFLLGIKAKIDFEVKAGIFWDKQQMQFIDYQHFNGNLTPVIVGESVGSYRLLDYYAFSTADRYVQAHLHYEFRSLLATQIMELRLLGIKENLFLNFLHTPAAGNYYELGYSIDNILRIGRIEFVSAFLNGKYDGFGFRIGLARNISN